MPLPKTHAATHQQHLKLGWQVASIHAHLYRTVNTAMDGGRTKHMRGETNEEKNDDDGDDDSGCGRREIAETHRTHAPNMDACSVNVVKAFVLVNAIHRPQHIEYEYIYGMYSNWSDPMKSLGCFSKSFPLVFLPFRQASKWVLLLLRWICQIYGMEKSRCLCDPNPTNLHTDNDADTAARLLLLRIPLRLKRLQAADTRTHKTREPKTRKKEESKKKN